jgi:hypothetical protein
MGPERQTRSFLDPAALARLARLPLLARRPMQGNVSGKHPSPHRGASVEFAEYRKYVQGDDLRRLDWRAFGRTDRHYIRECEADTNLRCMLVVDTSGSMAFGSATSWAPRGASCRECANLCPSDDRFSRIRRPIPWLPQRSRDVAFDRCRPGAPWSRVCRICYGDDSKCLGYSAAKTMG